MKRYVPAVLLLLAGLAPLCGQSPELQALVLRRIQTVGYLENLQTAEGGFLPAVGEKQPSLRATSSALRALKYNGGKVPNAQACIKFVSGCFDKASGGFTDRPGQGKPDVVTTAVGLMAVVELKMPAGDYAGPATEFLAKNARTFEEVRMAAAGLEAIGKKSEKNEDWLKMLAGMRNKDGTFGKGDDVVRSTGGAVAAQLRLGEKIDNPERVVKALRGGQRADGGFGKEGAKTSDLETSYRVM